MLSYALFSFDKLLRRHGLHHSFPAGDRDPDFHDGVHTGPLRWYVHFMLHYLTAPQLIGMAALFNLLQHVAGVALENLLILWAAPALLSTCSFLFRDLSAALPAPQGGISLPIAPSAPIFGVASLLTRFHFGYHPSIISSPPCHGRLPACKATNKKVNRQNARSVMARKKKPIS